MFVVWMMFSSDNMMTSSLPTGELGCNQTSILSLVMAREREEFTFS
jgi:hypothetical protein